MAGFLGKQFLLSNNGLGANAEEHSTVTLKDGTIVTGYFTANGGPVSFYSFNPKTKEIKDLGSLGTLSTNLSDPSLSATDSGGFRIVYSRETRDGAISFIQYAADGTVEIAKQLVTGWIENARAYDTKTGFFAYYRDRSPDAGEPEYVGAFYDNAGNLLKKIDLTTGANPSGFSYPEPQATELSNGNMAVVWKKSSLDESTLQIFRPNGNKVGAEITLPDIPLKSAPQVIEALPGGGFAVAHAPVVSPPGGVSYLGPIVIQKYTNAGVKKGPEIRFDTTSDIGSIIQSGRDFDIAFTKDGLIALAWTGKGVSTASGSDVYFAVLSPSGRLIVGPTPADETLNDDQLEVQFNYLKNGELFLTFKDDATVQFSHVASIQGRFIVEPDYIWEGDKTDNTKAGTIGNDVLLGLLGNDTLSGGKGEDFIRGGKGNDSLSGGNRLDILYGENGADKLSGDKGNDMLFGGAGKDTLWGGAGTDDLRGGEGDDTLRGGKGDDMAYGNTGDDRIFGDGGNDQLFGEAGNDRLNGGEGADQMEGGDGRDILKGGTGNDNLSGGTGRDKLVGGAGFDVLRGGSEKDVLRGGDDNDQLYGDDGNDTLYGEAGNDTFYSEAGNDIFFGGAGADTFQFVSTGFGRDRIKDFEAGVDKLDMGFLANALNATGDSIKVKDVASGVKFTVDADNWVIIENLTLSQLTKGTDYFIDSPF
jgi:Ca2+-binding RTX toxin-like protein